MTADQPDVYLGLGSNLGDRRRNLAVALLRLEPLFHVDAVSSLYETEPVGPDGQPPYYNAACRGTTGLSAETLLRHVQEIEIEIGRRRGERWGPRPIDIDLLLYGKDVIETQSLRVPHSELPNRAFVLVPLADVGQDASHPQLGETIASLAKSVDRSGLELVAGAGWQILPA